jgi:hypothetical protein
LLQFPVSKNPTRNFRDIRRFPFEVTTCPDGLFALVDVDRRLIGWASTSSTSIDSQGFTANLPEILQLVK